MEALLRSDGTGSFVLKPLTDLVITDEERQIGVEAVLARCCRSELRLNSLRRSLGVFPVLCSVFFLFYFDAISSLEHDLERSLGLHHMVFCRCDGEFAAAGCAGTLRLMGRAPLLRTGR